MNNSANPITLNYSFSIDRQCYWLWFMAWLQEETAAPQPRVCGTNLAAASQALWAKDIRPNVQMFGLPLADALASGHHPRWLIKAHRYSLGVEGKSYLLCLVHNDCACGGGQPTTYPGGGEEVVAGVEVDGGDEGLHHVCQHLGAPLIPLRQAAPLHRCRARNRGG